MDTKQHLRTTLKAKRLELTSSFKAEQAVQFCTKLQNYLHLDSLLRGNDRVKIGVYLAGKGELDLQPSIHWLWTQDHQLYAPIIKGNDLIFGEYTPTTPLKTNQFGLFEPDAESTISPEHLDYVLIPLLGFDKQGHRLGMGKGYYDRAFAFHTPGQKPILIGCAYAFQEVPELPHEAHDVMLDIVLMP